jgi:hypothetical protein
VPIRQRSAGFSPRAKLAIIWSRDSMIGECFGTSVLVVIRRALRAGAEPG